MSVLRADAQRNHRLVLEAAAQAFAELGPDVSVDEIARRAGVGHGTVFRRFPTKDALMAAVLELRLEELCEQTETLLGGDDPWASFEQFVWFTAEACARDRALYEGVARCECFAGVSGAKAHLHEQARRLIRQAQRAGSLRRDVTSDDVAALVGSIVVSSARIGEPEAWRRYIGVVLDGLRTPAHVA